jgi:anaerobic selenocysteine-containing dehydrogenase
MHGGKVDTLVILDANPVYDAPADLDFAAAMARVTLSIQLATYVDETAQHATFHAPALHVLESWGDARAFDGTAAILQPQTRPLVNGRTAVELIALIAGDAEATARELVRNHWRRGTSGDFDAAWTGWLRKGLIDVTASPEDKGATAGGFHRFLAQAAAHARHHIVVAARPLPAKWNAGQQRLPAGAAAAVGPISLG